MPTDTSISSVLRAPLAAVADEGLAGRDLPTIVAVKPVGDGRFTGPCHDIGTPSVYGGLVLAQAVMAARATLPAQGELHSLHAYFLSLGVQAPIDYAVERLRDGKNYSARRVTASQSGGVIFEATVSAQVPEPGMDAHPPQPAVVGPSGLQSETAYRAQTAEQWPVHQRALRLAPLGIEYRRETPLDMLNPVRAEGPTRIWLKACQNLPGDMALHQALLAYASDHGLLVTAIAPYPLSLARGEVRLASLDHTLWFHRPFRMDDWLLYVVECRNIGGGRALCKGEFFQQGRLVASVAQEGLMRVAPAAQARQPVAA
ncbi:MAG: acyl-CoA thioesterase II [Rhodoferax sp.]|jgi:acyl-CoA thioesterase-2|nr:acyl-CoA thioesterase II [Rhodoferax sp.]